MDEILKNLTKNNIINMGKTFKRIDSDITLSQMT